VCIVRVPDRAEFGKKSTNARYYAQSFLTSVLDGGDGKMHTVYTHDYLK
jgi:hypothetical protein